MTYDERIRHPDGALNPPQEKRGLSRLSWILLAIVVALVLAWRSGWFGKIVATGAAAVEPIANPHGWV